MPSLKTLMQEERDRHRVTFREAANKIGLGFWVPPGVPTERVAILRKAFEAMMASKGFKVMADKSVPLLSW